MKPTSPLSLFLFLQYVSAAPIRIPASDSRFPSTCQSPACGRFLKTLSHSRPNSAPTKHTDPHFPPHQLSPAASVPEFNNQPLSPPEELPATIGLSAPRPLSSTYLLSLQSTPPSTPQGPLLPQSPAEDALPAKPTSELAALRVEDAKRYWADRAAEEHAQSQREMQAMEGVAVLLEGNRKLHLCGGARIMYVKGRGLRFAREYSDLLVVGIVVLFLALVVLEAYERIGDLKQILSGTRRRRGEMGRGEIYLEDDNEVMFIVKKPFELQPAPSPRSKPKPARSVGNTYERENEDEETDVEEFGYDSDACEKI